MSNLELRHQKLGLTDDEAIQIYYFMLLARRTDERLWLLNRAGKIPFVVSCQGQEAAQVGAAFALDKSQDYLLPYYRDMGLVLAFGMSVKDIMLNNYAKPEDPNSGGRQMPAHYGGKKYRIVTQSSPVTTQVPHAAGISLAAKMEGKSFITFTTFGEGSSNQGDFHEGLNFAGVHKLPAVFMCENNQYAISVPLSKQIACKSVADRGIGYGMPGYSVDGNDPLDVYAVVKEAVDRARRGEGPTLIEAVVHRLTAHSSDDDHKRYRSKEELELMQQNDPIKLYKNYLVEANVLTDEKVEEMEKEIKAVIDEATEYAEQAPDALPEDALTHVYGE